MVYHGIHFNLEQFGIYFFIQLKKCYSLILTKLYTWSCFWSGDQLKIRVVWALVIEQQEQKQQQNFIDHKQILFLSLPGNNNHNHYNNNNNNNNNNNFLFMCNITNQCKIHVYTSAGWTSFWIKSMLANMPSPPEDAPPNRIYKGNDTFQVQYCT